MLNLNLDGLKKIIKSCNGDLREVLSQLNISKGPGEEEDIVELFEELGLETRICGICNKIIINGYCIDDGNEYACQDECLHQIMTDDEFQELYDDGEGSTYYTDWTELDENGQVIGGMKYAIQ